MSSSSSLATAKTSNPSSSATAAKTDAATSQPQQAPPSPYEPTDQAVLEYLQKKGMGTAVLELTARLQDDKVAQAATGTVVGKGSGKGIEAPSENKEPGSPQDARQRLEEEESAARNQRSSLTKSTGGGYGYDRDSTWQVLMWGVPDAPTVPPTPTTTATEGEEPASLEQAAAAAVVVGADEARAYVDSFCHLQLWVLSLPDDDHWGVMPASQHALERARKLLQEQTTSTTEGDEANQAATTVSLRTIMKELAQPSAAASSSSVADASALDTLAYNVPPSSKPELLAVTFCLFVHVYCELLEFGMETTARVVRDAFEPLYEPLYAQEYRDLRACQTTEDMMKLNTHNSQHMESINQLRGFLVQMASYQLRREELKAQSAMNSGGGGGRPLTAEEQKKIAEYDRSINAVKQKYNDVAKRVAIMFEKLRPLPFLRRARAVRWQLTLSHATYSLLMNFLNSRDGSLLPMSTLLQIKCELHVERRDPLPFVPASVLLDDGDVREGKEGGGQLNDWHVNWAAPLPRLLGDDDSAAERLEHFPKYHLDAEYETKQEAAKDKVSVKFNRALLMNGFRRLEALERKREYEGLPGSAKKKKLDTVESSMVQDPLQPTILQSTLCASASGPFLRPPASSTSTRSTDALSIWEESGIGMCCVKQSPPDGRYIAVGCDDASIRIWNTMDDGSSKKNNSQERSTVLLGHTNGFPVFDLDWNRDGRTLFSAGGDGSVRLWDTLAVGPYGELTTLKPSFQQPAATKSDLPVAEGSDMDVPGLRPEKAPYSNGAALAVYRGHVPSAPVWSVAVAPSGYYFASAGADSTARLWTTERPAPVRLFTGHTNSNVNCVEWHPNCNYIVTGSDDKTVRLWDIQSGRTVRLLSGCPAGINAVKVSPGGRYVAGADHSGTVHFWDLGTGKKVTEFRTATPRPDSAYGQRMGMVHSMDFSACGTALATGGDDCTVRIWDVREAALQAQPLLTTPVKSYTTKHTLIMDLQYTKRNLLLSVGKVVNPIPLARA